MPQEPGALIGIAEIADLAAVGRSAVSMWRKRHPDFPLARVDTPSGVLFDLGEVERWLIEAGKIDRIAPSSVKLWSRADALRHAWAPEELASFTTSVLVFLEACARATRPESEIKIEDSSLWKSIRQLRPRDAIDELHSSAARIEEMNAGLRGLLLPGLTYAPESDPARLVELINSVDQECQEDPGAAVRIFEETRSRLYDFDRFAEEHGTPDDLSHLMVQLAGNADTVVDPAVGTGGLLLLWALEQEASRPKELIGFDVNSPALLTARARFFLSEVDAHLTVRNTLHMRPAELPRSQLVLLDPPMNVSNWGDAKLYTDDKWRYGTPPPSSANWAWMQLAYLALGESGRAVVALPSGDMSRQGREGAIRAAMVHAGAVEAVVLLPARLRRNTSIPLSLWILRRDEKRRDDRVLLVDASAMGTASRSVHTLDEAEIDRIAALFRWWRATGEVQPTEARIATSVSSAQIDENASDLNPRRYLTGQTESTAELNDRASELRARVKEAHDESTRATLALLDMLGRQ